MICRIAVRYSSSTLRRDARGPCGAKESLMTASLLVGTVAAAGVLHTLVPDHWAPIIVIARQRRWSARRTVQAAAIAGVGHVTSVLRSC
jgi:hypothetical protein